MNIDDNTHRKNEPLFYIRMNISAIRLDKDLKKKARPMMLEMWNYP